MTTQPTPKRWGPRFSVRTLVIVVTLVCCYAACWGPTKTRGVEDVALFVGSAERSYVQVWTTFAAAPLVVRADHFVGISHYYFWFFGYVAKLPYERDVR